MSIANPANIDSKPEWKPAESSREDGQQNLELDGLSIRVWKAFSGRSWIGCADHISMPSLVLDGADADDAKRKAVIACKERLLVYVERLNAIIEGGAA